MEKHSTHFDNDGNAIMVDITGKTDTTREAVATGEIKLSADAFSAVEKGTVKKGDVLAVARIAGIMATKRTPELIPLCHPVPLGKCTVDFELDKERLCIKTFSTVKSCSPTGVEMEALTCVNITLLTIYDMCKSIDMSMEIRGIMLLSKSGGKSGDYLHEENKK